MVVVQVILVVVVVVLRIVVALMVLACRVVKIFAFSNLPFKQTESSEAVEHKLNYICKLYLLLQCEFYITICLAERTILCQQLCMCHPCLMSQHFIASCNMECPHIRSLLVMCWSILVTCITHLRKYYRSSVPAVMKCVNLNSWQFCLYVMSH